MSRMFGENKQQWWETCNYDYKHVLLQHWDDHADSWCRKQSRPFPSSASFLFRSSSAMGDLRLFHALGLSIPSRRLLEKYGDRLRSAPVVGIHRQPPAPVMVNPNRDGIGGIPAAAEADEAESPRKQCRRWGWWWSCRCQGRSWTEVSLPAEVPLQWLPRPSGTVRR